ncbi:MAG TPA: TatD family hydrolase [Flavobacteriales bacterium]|nr:TatD family hydrolase [Flavobacteriales bacterium]
MCQWHEWNFSMYPIDFHTHRIWNSNYIQVFNLVVKNETIPQYTKHFTAGIHPWYLTELDERKKEIEKIALDPACIAIGECGIDKICVNDLKLQQAVFEYQCELAVKLNKPIVIHAVKSHFDCAEILKRSGIKKAVFHGFNSRYTILEKILQEGYMVSFGEHIMQKKSPAASLIKSVPTDRFFLETDNSEKGIYNIYNAACDLLSLKFEELVNIQHKNFNTFIA